MIYRKQWVIPLCWNVLCNPKGGTAVSTAVSGL